MSTTPLPLMSELLVVVAPNRDATSETSVIVIRPSPSMSPASSVTSGRVTVPDEGVVTVREAFKNASCDAVTR